MTDLLTVRQVQDILKVDRITVYRMLNDGRLTGRKIGQQWRFRQEDVERLLNGEPQIRSEADYNLASDGGFPTHCVQTIQELFAEVGGTAAIVFDQHGNPLTEISKPNGLYRLLMSTEGGSVAYHQLWQSVGSDCDAENSFTCPAGMQYFCKRIDDRGGPAAFIAAGQFYSEPGNEQTYQQLAEHLSKQFGLQPTEALAEIRQVRILDIEGQRLLRNWMPAAVKAIESILTERVRFIDRLQKIASLTQIN